MPVPRVRASVMIASGNEMGSIADMDCSRAGDTDDGSERLRCVTTDNGRKMPIVGDGGCSLCVRTQHEAHTKRCRSAFYIKLGCRFGVVLN